MPRYQIYENLKLDVEGTGQTFGNLKYEAGPRKTGSSYRPGEEVESPQGTEKRTQENRQEIQQDPGSQAFKPPGQAKEAIGRLIPEGLRLESRGPSLTGPERKYG